MTEFKIGDKVQHKWLEDTKGNRIYIGTIVLVEDNLITVELDNPLPIRYMEDGDRAIYFDRTFITKIRDRESAFEKLITENN